jgi:hypothetical protein
MAGAGVGAALGRRLAFGAIGVSSDLDSVLDAGNSSC